MFSPNGNVSPRREEESQATPRQVDAAAAVTRDRHALPPGAQPASASSSSSTAKAPVRPGFAAKSSPAARPSLTIGIPIRRSPPPPAPPAKQAGVPTPAAREFTAAVAATHYGQSLVGSDHHQVGSLKRYAFNWDGSSKGQTDVEEFLDKLNIIATGLQLSDEATLCLLTLSVTDGAYATVSSLLGRSTESAATRLTTAKAELRRRYGATPVKSFKDLSKVVLTDFDSIDALAVKLRKLTIQAFPALHADAVDQVCKMFFFSLLPENHSATAQLLPSMLDTEKSTAQLVHLARHSFEDLMAQNQASRILAVAPFYGQSSHSGKGKGSGGKGRGSGKGKGKGRFGLHKPLGKPFCDFCDRPGHHTAQCRKLKKVKQTLQEPGPPPASTTVPSSQVGLPMVKHHGRYFLIDSGAQQSLISKRHADELGLVITPQETVYSSLTTHFTTPFRTVLRILGVCLVVNVTAEATLFPLSGKQIDGILGCDFIATFGSVLLTTTLSGTHGPTVKAVLPDSPLTPISFPCPPHPSVSGSALAIPSCDEVTAEIVRKDFTVRRYRRSDGSQYWQCTWVWKSPEAAQRAARFRPAVYQAQFDQFPPAVHKLWRAELQLWQDWGFIRQVQRDDLRSSITLILISQPHKSSTPVRPVLDFKPVNAGLVSYPNETGHITCGATLRRWRAGYSHDGRLTESWVLMDIKKAYMCIHMHPTCSVYQGITLVDDDGTRTYWELTRLAFGVSIAPKVLRAVIDFILVEAGIDGGVEPYFDDLRVPKSQLDQVVTALNHNGFSLKDPEEAETARILGLQRAAGNIWTRRSPIGPIQGSTYHHLKSWVATLACSHYPVLRWLRPAARGLERIAHLENPSASKSTPLSHTILRKCEALYHDISSRGDPATGTFTVDAGSTWKLFCDASDSGLGACLYFGPSYVEDVSWLRKLNDIRPIDVVELEAVLRGLNALVLPWRRALGLTGQQPVEVYTDNRPVLGQLQRKLASHWHSSKGLTAGSAESRLQMIEDTIEVSGLSVTYHYVESERNPADHLTRVPTYLRWLRPAHRPPAPQLAAPALVADTPESWRDVSTADSAGLHLPESHLDAFLAEVHDDHHEGSEGLFNRLRGWVRAPGLRARCRHTIQQCAICRASKAHPFQNSDGLQVDDGIGRKRTRTPAEVADTRRSSVPFNKLHLDIVGPFRKVNDRPQFYVITCICNATGYALGKPVRSTPVGKDVIDLLSHIFATFHTHPLVLCTDGGSNLVSGQVTEFLMGYDILPQVTAKNTSLSNGRIERLHRTMEEYLRSHVRCDQISYTVFHRTVGEFLRMYNTTPLRGGQSAHDKVFTFPANCDRFRPVRTRPEYDSLCRDPRETWGPGFAVTSPVLLRVMRPTNKLSRRWIPATIAERLGKKTYSLVGMPGKFDLKDLKPLADSRFTDP